MDDALDLSTVDECQLNGVPQVLVLVPRILMAATGPSLYLSRHLKDLLDYALVTLWSQGTLEQVIALEKTVEELHLAALNNVSSAPLASLQFNA